MIYSAEAWRALAEERGKEIERLRAALLEEDAERYRWLRGQDWIDDSIMNEYLIAPEIPSTLDRAIDAERKRRASLPTGDV